MVREYTYYTMIVLRKHIGWCVVIGNRMIPVLEFMRGPLRKPSTEVQAKAAFKSLSKTYDPDFHG